MHQKARIAHICGKMYFKSHTLIQNPFASPRFSLSYVVERSGRFRKALIGNQPGMTYSMKYELFVCNVDHLVMICRLDSLLSYSILNCWILRLA